MTTVRSAQDIAEGRRKLYDPLRTAVGTGNNGRPVGELIPAVATQEDAELDLVVAAMWDLVEEGQLDYGTDARVRPVAADAVH